MTKAAFVIESLRAHDRSGFSCGVEALDQYLRRQASQDAKRLVARCFVAVETATHRIAGYYTLAATSVPASDLTTEELRRLPRYPVLPAALIGRLAVDEGFQRKDLGGALLADAALRALEGDVAAFALVVDAIDDNALAFYRRHGFRPFASRPSSLFMPLGTAKKGAAP